MDTRRAFIVSSELSLEQAVPEDDDGEIGDDTTTEKSIPNISERDPHHQQAALECQRKSFPNQGGRVS